jgi:hypothetical protein
LGGDAIGCPTRLPSKAPRSAELASSQPDGDDGCVRASVIVLGLLIVLVALFVFLRILDPLDAKPGA